MRTEIIFTLYAIVAVMLCPLTVLGFITGMLFAVSAWCITEAIIATLQSIQPGGYAGIVVGGYALAVGKVAR